MKNDTITAVRGVRVGHAEVASRPTGCTVVLFDRALPTAVDVRGGAPGTLETDRLAPSKSFPQTDAILLSGGSAFGLDAAAGVRRWLVEHRRGRKFLGRAIPLVSAAIIFDLGARDGAPDSEVAYRATAAATDAPVVEGSVGAGRGATVGKLQGLRCAMMGGVGSCGIELRGGLHVGALVVVNAVGNVVDPATGRTIAGTRREDGRGFVPPEEAPALGTLEDRGVHGTTIGVVATNARLMPGQLLKVAEMAHDGIARAIRPSHMTTDGDTLFAVATGQVPVPLLEEFPYTKVDWVGHAAAECVARAIVRAARSARSERWPGALGGGIPGLASQRRGARGRG